MPSKSPKNSKSPKSKKGDKSPKSKGKGSRPEEDGWVFVKPPPDPPPPVPPKPTILSNLRRQVWYPYANRLSFEHKEWFWTPYCPLITSWGDIWITNPQQRCILRYKFDPVSSKIEKIAQPLVTKGEPKMLIEIPRTGRIAVLLYGPTALKSALVLYDPIELKEDKRRDLPFNAVDPSEIPTITLPDGKAPEPRLFDLLDESTPVGLCANQTLLIVLFQPLQKLLMFNPITLMPINVMLENGFPDERTCVHLASSGGCAVNEKYLYVAATRPSRIQVFYLHTSQALGRIDVVHVVMYAELGLDRLSFGEPFGVQVDTFGLLVVSDSKGGFFHVYNINKRPLGPWLPSLPHGETCFLGSWKIDPYQPIRPGHFSLAKNGTACVVDRWNNKIHLITDQAELRWYDDTFCILGDVPFLREVVDPLMPKSGLPNPPQLRSDDVGSIRRKISELTEPYPDEIILPPTWIEKYTRKTKESDIPANEKSPKGKSKSSKKDSKGKKSKDSKGKKK